MTERHKTIFDIDVDSRRALKEIATMQSAMDKLAETAQKISIGEEKRREKEKAEKAKDKAERDKEREKQRKESLKQKHYGSASAGFGMAAMGAVGVAGGGLAGSPGAVVAGVGAAIGGMLKGIVSLTRAVGEAAEELPPGFSHIIGTASKLFAAMTAAASMSAQHRFGVANQVAGMEKAAVGAGHGGIGPGSLQAKGIWQQAPSEQKAGHAMGMNIQEQLQQYGAAGRAAGVVNGMRGVPLLKMMRAGASAGAIGGAAGTAAFSLREGRGSRRRGDARRFTQSIVNAGSRGGLTGSKLDEFITTATGTIRALAAQGISTNLNAYGRVQSNVSTLMGPGGAMDAAQTTKSLAMMPAQAKQQMLAPFAEAGKALMLAKAFEGGGGFLDAMDRLGEMGPGGAFDALNTGGDNFIGRSLLRMTARGDRVDSLFGEDLAGDEIKTGGRRNVLNAGAAAVAKAKGETAMMTSMTSAGAEKWIHAQTKLQATLDRIAATQDGNLRYILKWVEKIADLL